MAYFPFFMDLEGCHGLIVGGGSVALRKAAALLEFGTNLTAVSITFCPSFRQLAEENAAQGRLKLIERPFHKEDLDDMLFVIAATDQAQVNRTIASLCQERRILVNVADPGEEGSFAFPALVKRDNMVVGISSGGGSPILAKSLRQKAELLIPPYYSALNEQLRQLRTYVKKIPIQEQRRLCCEELLAAGEERKRALSEEEYMPIIRKYFPSMPLT